MSTALEVAGRLRNLKTALSTPQEFYFSVLPQWTELARTVTANVLAVTKPPDMTDETWARESAATVERVAATLVSEEAVAGIIIALGPRAPGVNVDDPKGYTIGGFGVREIEQFVAAGRAGDPDGKDLTRFPAKDADKSDLQIAWRIAYAIKLQKPGFERVLEHIAEFLGHVALDAAEKQYDEILKVWRAVFVPRAIVDFSEWVGSRVARTMR